MPNLVTIQFSNIGPLFHSWQEELPWDGEEIIRAIKRHSFCLVCETHGHGSKCQNRACDTKQFPEQTWPYTTTPDISYDDKTGKVYKAGYSRKGTFAIV